MSPTTPTHSALSSSPRRRRKKERQRPSSSRRKSRTRRSPSPRRPLSPRADQLIQQVSSSRGSDVVETDKSFRIDSGSFVEEQLQQQENKSDRVETEVGASHFSPKVLGKVSSLVGQRLEHHYHEDGDRKLSPSKRTTVDSAHSSPSSFLAQRKYILRGDMDSDTLQRNNTYEDESGAVIGNKASPGKSKPEARNEAKEVSNSPTGGMGQSSARNISHIGSQGLLSDNHSGDDTVAEEESFTQHISAPSESNLNAFIGIIHRTDRGLASELEQGLKSADLKPDTLRALGQYIDAVSGGKQNSTEDLDLKSADTNPETLRALGQYIDAVSGNLVSQNPTSSAEEESGDEDTMANVLDSEVLNMVGQYIDAVTANPATTMASWEKEFAEDESEPMHSLEDSEDDVSSSPLVQKSGTTGEDTISSDPLPPAAAAAARALKEEAEKQRSLKQRDPPSIWSASADSSDREDPPIGSLSKEGGRWAFEVERNPRKKESLPVKSKKGSQAPTMVQPEPETSPHRGGTKIGSTGTPLPTAQPHSKVKPEPCSVKTPHGEVKQVDDKQTSEASGDCNQAKNESEAGETGSINDSQTTPSRISIDAPGVPGTTKDERLKNETSAVIEAESTEGEKSRKTGTAGGEADDMKETKPTGNVVEKAPRDSSSEVAETCKVVNKKEAEDANVCNNDGIQSPNVKDSLVVKVTDGKGEDQTTEKEEMHASNDHVAAGDIQQDASTPKHAHNIESDPSVETTKHAHNIASDPSVEEKKEDDDHEDLDIFNSPTMKKLWIIIRKSPEAQGSNNSFESFVQQFQLAFPFFERKQPSAVECARLQVQSRRKDIPVAMTNSLLEQLQSLQDRERALGLHPPHRSIQLLASSQDLALRQEALLRRLLEAKEAERRRNVLIYSTAASANDEEAVEIDLSDSFKVSVKDYPDTDISDEDKWWEAAAKLEKIVEESRKSDDIDNDLPMNSTGASSQCSYEPTSVTDESAPYATTSCSNSRSLDDDIKGFWARRKLKRSLRRTPGQFAALKPYSFSLTDNETERSYVTGMSACSSFTTFRGGDGQELWIRRREMALWSGSGTGWLSGGNVSTTRNPKSINAVATTAFFERPAFMQRRRNPGTIQWMQPYNPRTKAHPGYFDVDVRSLYASMEHRGRPHPLDRDPWEGRDVKQRFLHEQSISYNRNWFGKTKKLYGNCQIQEPVCCPQSMEMPMKAGEWTKEWYTKPWSSPSPGASVSTNATHREIQKIRNQYGLDDSDDDNGSWEETPECGTFRNVRLKPGERISRVTPDLTSSLRRSRWRKKHFPKRTFPY